MSRYSYMVGALLATVTVDYENTILKECGEAGWELVSVVFKRHKKDDYTFFYFRREIGDSDSGEQKPRFDTDLFAKIN